MDEDTLTDLKQFIAATVRQEVSGLGTARDFERLRAEMATKEDLGLLKEDVRLLKEDVRELRAEMSRRFDEVQQDIAEALDTSNDVNGKQWEDHERRITKLEQQRAA